MMTMKHSMKPNIPLAPSPSLRASLRSLIDPRALGAMMLLLTNDHLLKGLAPGLVTGKLSDLAGIYFFPLLLAALLSTLPLRARPRAIGAAAFAITGIRFALMKGTALGNEWSVAFVSFLVGQRVAPR